MGRPTFPTTSSRTTQQAGSIAAHPRRHALLSGAPLLLAMLVGCADGAEAEPSDAKETGRPGAMSELPEHPKAASIRQNLGLGASALEGHLANLLAHAEDGPAGYESSLAKLRETPALSAELVERTYHALRPERQADRWKLVHTLGVLETEHALGTLEDIASEPMPEAIEAGMHDAHAGCGGSAAEEEIMIRTRAVRGLMGLAALGRTDARDALWRVAGDAHNLARSTAVQALLMQSTDRDKTRAELESLLEEDARWMLALRAATDADFTVERPANLPDSEEPNRPAPTMSMQTMKKVTP